MDRHGSSSFELGTTLAERRPVGRGLDEERDQKGPEPSLYVLTSEEMDLAKGVGGGMTAKPLGFIVIDRHGVRFQRTPQPTLAPLAMGVVIGLALAMRLIRPPRPRIAG
jgi:hypothetical protein